MSALPRLIALTPGDLAGPPWRGFLKPLEAALAAGLPGLLLREPGLSDRATLELARAIRALPQRPWLALHDRVHLACELAVEAVHLSFRSLRPAELRWLPSEVQVGLSTHADDAPGAWDGADYLFHGPLHATEKRGFERPPLGLAGLTAARARTALPVFALGGVGPSDAAALRRAGLHGVAVRTGIFSAPDPGTATRAYLEALR